MNWPSYDPSAIGEVRVIRGGGAVGHGPGALAGVIEMSSNLQLGMTADAFVGSRDSQEARLRVGAATGAGAINMSGRVARGDGFIPVTRQTRGSADRAAPYGEANIRASETELSQQLELQLAMSAFTDRRQRGLAFTSNDSDGADASVRLMGSRSWEWSASAYAQRREFASSFASVDDGRTTATRVSLQDAVPLMRGVEGSSSAHR